MKRAAPRSLCVTGLPAAFLLAVAPTMRGQQTLPATPDPTALFNTAVAAFDAGD